MTDAIIDIASLAKTYRGGGRKVVHAVRDVTLRVERRSITGLVGPNGAGKTSTIHLMLGLLKADSGRIRVFGLPPGPDALRRIGYQPEIFTTYPFYSARETMRFYGRLSGLTSEDVDRRAAVLFERVGLSDVANRRVATFSKGMTQRLGLAQALLHDPELLILDEPTSGLDPEGRRLVIDIIQEERAKGRTILLSSHILPDVERTCDAVVMIRQGQVAFAEAVAASADAGEWAIEVRGWHAGAAADLAGCTFSVVTEREDSAVIQCDASGKKALLRTLLDGPFDIRTVQPHRRDSLEARYLEHTGNGRTT